MVKFASGGHAVLRSMPSRDRADEAAGAVARDVVRTGAIESL
jgi:hypothetical protein